MAATRTPRSGASAGKDGGGPKGRRRDREVLKAATTVFYRRGYADATVQDVADALGMLKGSLYYYITSKEELLYRLAVEVHDDVDALLSEALALDNLSALRRIQEFVARQVEYNIRKLEAISVYHHDVHHLSKNLRSEIVQRWRAHEAVVISLVEQAQREGDIPSELDPYILTQNIYATVIWMYRWYRRTSGISAAALRDACVAFVTDGIAGSRRRGTSPS
jgi:TetR/AcrR family transcriptional regulator, cholesterol catabolism regulator